MTRYAKLLFWTIFLGLVTLPCYASAASITQTTAAIGENCTASGVNSTAMGYHNTTSGSGSTAMGYYNTTSGSASFVGGKNMFLTDTADYTFVWGVDDYSPQSISTAYAFLIFPAGIAGKVGIGTKSPQHLLDLGGSQGKKMAIFQKTTGDDFYGFGISPATLEIYAGANASDSPAMVVKKTTKRVGIGTISPGYLLEVNGSAAKPGGGSWSNSSDERLKDITGEYKGGLIEILELRPVTFHYKDMNARGLPSGEEYVGFIAQEVKEVFPEAVSEGPDGYLDFNMHPVNVAVVNAIKELKDENDNLKAENDMLRKKIEKIEALLGI